MQTVTQVMTDYVAAAKFDGLPPTVIHQAKRTFLELHRLCGRRSLRR